MVLDGASSGLWFDGWKAAVRRRAATRTPSVRRRWRRHGRGCCRRAGADRARGSGGGPGPMTLTRRTSYGSTRRSRAARGQDHRVQARSVFARRLPAHRHGLCQHGRGNDRHRCRRPFDDRLEIENPGLLPFGLTIEDLPRGVSKLRNRVIGRVFHELRLIEHWGSGAQRMIASCQQAGVPVPIWEEIGTRLRVTMSTEPVDAATADPMDQAILNLLDGGDRTTREIAGAIGRSTRATRTRLSRLVDPGQLVAIGRGPQDPRRVYRRT